MSKPEYKIPNDDTVSPADIYPEAELSGADLSDANLRRADLSGADLSGADLSEADLSGADLSEADLRDADFSGANLSMANLSDTHFDHVNLSEANLYEANLEGCKFTSSILQGANFNGADVGSANFHNIVIKGGDRTRETFHRNRRLGKSIKTISSIGLMFFVYAIAIHFFIPEIFDNELALLAYSILLFLLYGVLGGLFIQLQSNAKIGSEVVSDE